MNVEDVVTRWGYFGVVAGAAIEGETIVIAAGALAHRGLLSLPLVIAAAFAGSVIGDQCWFQIGRRYGKPFIEKHPAIKNRIGRIDRWTKKFGDAFVIAFRFIYGIRMATPVYLGSRDFPLKKFLLLDLIGGALWATTISTAGYLLGASLQRLLHRAGKIEEIALAAIAVTAVAVLLIRELIVHSRMKRATKRDATTSSRPPSSHRAAAHCATRRPARESSPRL